ncbi:transposase domain-containing protein [Rhizobium sp. CG4]|uniref:transposase domain-containing protein n=1 Tax=Rhizobium sp. CG4 TaxID=2726075 RepID=UPI0033305660
MILTAKLNNIDPKAWLADVLVRVATTPVVKLELCFRGIGRLQSLTLKQPELRPLPDAYHHLLQIDRASGL